MIEPLDQFDFRDGIHLSDVVRGDMPHTFRAGIFSVLHWSENFLLDLLMQINL